MRILCGTILVAVFALNAVAGEMFSRVIAPWDGEVTSVSTNDGVVCVDYALRPTERSFIRCQLLLPAKEKWSGRFWGQGNGGQAGGKPGAMPAFANAGDAVAHTDMGSSDDRAYGNPEAWTDFSHRATHLMTLSAKALVKAHYGRPPRFSYFYGASTGGNQGLMEAERHPEDYDAILAIVPAFARVPYHVKYVWNARQVFRPDGSRAITDSQMATVEKAVLDWFAYKDEPYARGRYLVRTFWTEADMDGVLALAASRDPSIGADDIKARFRAVWEGPVVNGRRAGLGLPPGARLSNWLAGRYTSKESWLWNWLSNRHRPLLSIADDELEAWAQGPARQFNATNPDLSRFFAHGGVLLMTGGTEDDICEPAPMIAFADEVIARNPAAKTNFRFYLNPGRAHGGVHRGLCDVENMWSALVAWREKGVAPDVMQGVFDWSEKGFPDDVYGGKSKDARRLPVAPWPDRMSGSDENGWRRAHDSPPAGCTIDPIYFRWDFGDAIQCAIDDCAAAGGGRVTVTSGRYRTRQIELKSGVELHLEKGAVLEGLPGIENYRRVELPFSEGAWMATVMCIGATNVAITGEGEIYGNGFAWPIYTKHQKDKDGKTVMHEGLRPRGVVFADCSNVRVEGIRLLDLPCWGLVFKRCEDVVVKGITIDSFANANSDGVDIEARNFTMTDCEINSGDDSVVFKSNDPNFVMENIYLSNVVGRTHCYNFKLGTASHGTMRDFLITDCRAEGPRRHNIDRRDGREEIWYKGNDAFPGATKESPGVSISSSAIAVECVDGGCVENITFRNMTLEGSCAPIFVRGGYRTGRACGIPPSDKCILRNILIENVHGWAESTTASSITGTEKCRIDGVTLRNVHIVTKGAGDTLCEMATPVPEHEGKYPNSSMFDNRILPAYGLYIRHADRVRLENTTFTLYPGHADTRPAVLRDDAP